MTSLSLRNIMKWCCVLISPPNRLPLINFAHIHQNPLHLCVTIVSVVKTHNFTRIIYGPSLNMSLPFKILSLLFQKRAMGTHHWISFWWKLQNCSPKTLISFLLPQMPGLTFMRVECCCDHTRNIFQFLLPKRYTLANKGVDTFELSNITSCLL